MWWKRTERKDGSKVKESKRQEEMKSDGAQVTLTLREPLQRTYSIRYDRERSGKS